MKRIFGGINLNWTRLIVFAIVVGIYTAIMAMLPIVGDTSFSDITVTFEVWILLGIFIIMNSKSATDSALKCFVFFVISQPLVYLVQDVINHSSLFIIYYRNWILWTIATLPAGFIGYYMKKDKWWGLLILTPILVFLGYHFSQYLGMTIFAFPRHLLTTVFCAITMILYPVVIFNNKKIKIAGAIIGILLILGFGIITLKQPQNYDTDILTNGGSLDVTFDDSYKVYLIDESMGTLDIRFVEQGLNDWVVHATFKKTGNTQVVLEAPSGQKNIFDISVERDTYDIKKR